MWYRMKEEGLVKFFEAYSIPIEIKSTPYGKFYRKAA